MRKTFLLLITLAATTAAMAQSSAVKSAAKAVITLTAYAADGTEIGSSHGVFITPDGEAIADLLPLIGAASATVTDSKGRQYAVSRLLGVNELYEVAHLKVEGAQKLAALPLAQQSAVSGSQLWVAPMAAKNAKAQTPVAATVTTTETFMDGYTYYICQQPLPEGATGCPMVNDQGEVVALAKEAKAVRYIHATDSRYAASLAVSGLSLNDATIKKIDLPIALPTDQAQAQLMLMMASSEPSMAKRQAIVDDFTAAYPTLPDGYAAQSWLQAEQGHYQRALAEAAKAYDLDPQPTYRYQQARIRMAMSDYAAAYDIYAALIAEQEAAFINPEYYYQAALCRQELGAANGEVLALLDSAINNIDTLGVRDAAPYFLTRALLYEQMDSFRQAVFDYTRYEIVMQGNVNDQFYYLRHQVEVKARLYKQALADIMRAIILAPSEPMYYAEKAQLEIRVNMLDEAIETATRCIRLAPDYPTAYLLLGLAQIKQGNKDDGLQNLEKAQTLGDPQAEQMIAKYRE